MGVYQRVCLSARTDAAASARSDSHHVLLAGFGNRPPHGSQDAYSSPYDPVQSSKARPRIVEDTLDSHAQSKSWFHPAVPVAFVPKHTSSLHYRLESHSVPCLCQREISNLRKTHCLGSVSIEHKYRSLQRVLTADLVTDMIWGMAWKMEDLHP